MGSDSYDRHFFPAGHYIMKEGEPARVAYLIEAGSVEILKTAEPTDLPLTTLHAGEIFGELGLLVDGTRTASVRAETDCNLIVISRDLFDKKLQSSDPLIQSVVKMLSRRVVAANEALTDDVESTD